MEVWARVEMVGAAANGKTEEEGEEVEEEEEEEEEMKVEEEMVDVPANRSVTANATTRTRSLRSSSTGRRRASRCPPSVGSSGGEGARRRRAGSPS